jgi:hypothetical protein
MLDLTALARPEDWEEPRAASPLSVAAAHRSAADHGRGGVTSALTHGLVPWDHGPFGIIQILFPERSVVPSPAQPSSHLCAARGGPNR